MSMTTDEPIAFQEHVRIPVGFDGEWPVDEDEEVTYRCWCGTPGCDKWVEEQ